MEFLQRIQNFKRNLDLADDPDAPWYRRKKIILIGGTVVLVMIGILLLFFGGYFAGLSSHTNNNAQESLRVLPPLEWQGICPKGSSKCPQSFQNSLPPLILISLDGFHTTFMDRGFTPTIKNLAKCGTHAQYMYPVFPSKTFPNHYSQVTGLYPSSHGIIDNTMYDPIKKKLFKVGQPESHEPYWWLKEPIWVTAVKQGKKTACYYWPGSDVKINGILPTYYKKYNSKISFESRVDQILAWLDLPPNSRPQFLTLYVNEPDHALHRHGLNAKQVDNSLSKVDRMIERLFSGLQERNLVNCVNVIIISDHGMSDIDCKKVINLQDLINVSDTFNTVGPFARIRPKGRRNATVVREMLSKLQCKKEHMRAFSKEELPVRLHYADSPRIEPIYLDIDAGWTVVTKSIKHNDDICSGGAHGYDNIFPDMRATFLAHGPSFKNNFTMQPFLNIELYEMLAELIDITPNPNNGTKGSMHYIMTHPQPLSPQLESKSPVVAYVPSDEKEYNERVSASGCCSQSKKQVQLVNIAASQDLHLPYGIPHSEDDESSVQLLHNENYISAFHLKLGIPMWTAFTLKEWNNYNKVDIDCWTGDARIPSNNAPKCGDYQNKYILQRALYPPGFSNSSSEDAFFITNSVAKSLNHSKILEEPFNNMLKRWIAESGELNVVFGPAFDIFSTGTKPSTQELMKIKEENGPLLIPTHIFSVITWCNVRGSSLKSCDVSKIDAFAFLLPNKPFPMNCESPADMINRNFARVVDVEKLTGISFYTSLPIYSAIRLKTLVPERL